MSAAAMTVRLNSTLHDFVTANISESGTYENVSEYIRSLIRRDKDQTEQATFLRLQAELQHAFQAPDSSYRPLTANDIIQRHAVTNNA